MERYAIFVDAGYLSSQALRILSGKTKSERSELKLQNPAALIAELTKQAQEAFGHNRLLRTYWYDGVGATITTEQTSIAVLPDVQFRAGTIHNRKQKGVDSRIVHDLFELASNRAIADAMVVTGDGDLAVGIEFAQRRGMRVALLSIEDIPNGVSANRHPELAYLADRQLTIGKKEVEALFRYEYKKPAAPAEPVAVHAPKAGAQDGKAAVAAPAQVTAPATSAEEGLQKAVDLLFAEIPAPARPTSLNSAGGVISEIDRQLLAKGRETLGRLLSTPERSRLRALFSEAIRKAEKA